MPLIRVGNPNAGIGRVSSAVHIAAKIGLLVPRGAFDLLVRYNVFGLASKLAAGIQKNRAAIDDFWYKVGGDFGALQDMVSKGASRHRILGTSTCLPSQFRVNGARIGSVTLASVGAALVAATPIIVACLATLKNLQVDTSDVPQGNFGNYAQQAYNSGGFNDATGTGYGTGGGTTNNSGGGYLGKDGILYPTQAAATASFGVQSNKIFGMSPMQLLLIAGGIYFVTKK